MTRSLYIIGVALVSLCQVAFASDRMPIRNFQSVTDQIFRGARPGEAGVAALSEMGVKTIVNLEDNERASSEELQFAKNYGIRVISIPLSVDEYPTDKQIVSALEAMDQASNQPVFIHCMHGQDRTGLVVGLYRTGYQRWTAEAAWNEMLKFGYHPKYQQLTRYFETATGFKAP